MNSDLNLEILLQLPYPDIINMCQISPEYNKICHTKHFWDKLFERDYYLQDNKERDTIDDLKRRYEKWYNVVDNHVIKIMTKLMVKRKNHDNLQTIYDELFYKLGHHCSDLINLYEKDRQMFVDNMVNDILALFGINGRTDSSINYKINNMIVKFQKDFNAL